jgi:hypothetical protein
MPSAKKTKLRETILSLTKKLQDETQRNDSIGELVLLINEDLNVKTRSIFTKAFNCISSLVWQQKCEPSIAKPVFDAAFQQMYFLEGSQPPCKFIIWKHVIDEMIKNPLEPSERAEDMRGTKLQWELKWRRREDKRLHREMEPNEITKMKEAIIISKVEAPKNSPTILPTNEESLDYPFIKFLPDTVSSGTLMSSMN